MRYKHDILIAEQQVTDTIHSSIYPVYHAICSASHNTAPSCTVYYTQAQQGNAIIIFDGFPNILYFNLLLCYFLLLLLLLLLLGPEHMLRMHRSHVGLLCYPRIIQVFLDVPTFRYYSVLLVHVTRETPSSERWNCVGKNHGR
jgi:hypothetical protein